jgi:hypothetical protein
MGPHNQTLGPIRETRRIVVFEQTGIQATCGLNTALQKTKHFVLRAGILAHRRARATQHSLNLVFLCGQRRWKNNRGFKAHDKCSDHLLSMAHWESYNIQKKNPGASIRNMLDPERPSVVENNREYMKTLLEYHR